MIAAAANSFRSAGKFPDGNRVDVFILDDCIRMHGGQLAADSGELLGVVHFGGKDEDAQRFARTYRIYPVA